MKKTNIAHRSSNRLRPRRHTRLIHTRKGFARVTINPHIIRYHHKLVNPKERGVIRPEERRIFNLMSNPRKYNKEFGGAIDFDLKGEVEHIDVHPGQEYEVYLPPDYEVQYHTHPDEVENPPTPEDIIALLGNDQQQAEMVFRDGRAFTIVKSPLTVALSKLPATQLKKKLDRVFNISMKKKNWEKDWAERLEEMGFMVFIDNHPNKTLSVKIHPVEPKKRRRF